ncbi:MAG: hypothetical protein OFPII_03770 [Osedax symbiont Rs1]|nr:MAG: hypothetical protein OFPII_03770 [Osedax symbiont Rs1]
MKNNASTSLQWLLQVSGRQQRMIWIAISLALLQVLVTLVAPVIIFLVIDGLLDNSLKYDDAMLYTGVVITAIALRYLCLFSAAFYAHKAAFILIGEIKIQLLEKIIRLPMSFIDQHRSADIRQIIHDDVDRIELFVAHHIVDFVSALFTPLATFVLLLWLDWQLALVALIPLPLALLMQGALFRGYAEKMQLFLSVQTELNRQVAQFIRGVAALRMFTGQGSGMSVLKESIVGYDQMLRGWVRDGSWPFALLKVSLDGSLVILLPVAAWMVMDAELSISLFVLFMMLGLGLTEPFYNMLLLGASLNQILGGVDRIRLIEQAEVASCGNRVWPEKAPKVQLDKVTFSYPGRSEPALLGLSITLLAGEKVAVVGASGSGKSTLLHLLAGFYRQQEGLIRIAGEPLESYSETQLYSNIGVVLQHNHIFNDTVRNNIGMGVEVSDEQIWQVLKLCEADDFIRHGPGQLDEVLGGHSARLSGGEQQRLAMARALLCPANLYLFDEATSFFDPLIEQRLINRLFEFCADSGFIFVTHRLPLARQADRIIVMHNGQVVGFDSHKNLLDNCDRYQTLISLDPSTKLVKSEEYNYV